MSSLPLGPQDNHHAAPRVTEMDSDKEMSTAVIDGNDQVTGHIISTTIGGKNGEPKRTISYMAERVVGTGSFGIVFQAKCLETGESVAIIVVTASPRRRQGVAKATPWHPGGQEGGKALVAIASLA